MINFQDLKALVEIVNNPTKYKEVMDQLDSRQKQWETLVEEYTEVEKVGKYIKDAEKTLDALKVEQLKVKTETELALNEVSVQKEKFNEDQVKEQASLKKLSAGLREKEKSLKEQETSLEAREKALLEKEVSVADFQSALEVEKSSLMSLKETLSEKLEALRSVNL